MPAKSWTKKKSLPEAKFTVLLDQNIPRLVAGRLRNAKPAWLIYHVAEIGLENSSDLTVFTWAQEHQAITITFDEDFADQRTFPIGDHCGVIRLKVWPTTIEETESALLRLIQTVDEAELIGALVIIDALRIRIRRKPQS